MTQRPTIVDSRESTIVADTAKWLPSGTKEKFAAIFLLDKKPIEDKIDVFREKIGDGSDSFIDYISGEHYLIDGKKKMALALFDKSHKQIEDDRKKNHLADTWLLTQVRSRLYILKEEGVQNAIAMEETEIN